MKIPTLFLFSFLALSGYCQHYVNLGIKPSSDFSLEYKNKAIISIIFDDTYESDKRVKELFDLFKLKPSFAIYTARLSEKNVHQYVDWYNEGCSILAHSMSHPKMSNSAEITSAVIESEMRDSKMIIEKYGINVNGWVTPSSKLDSIFLPVLEKYFEYGFTNLSGGKFDSSVSPYKMSRYSIESNVDPNDHNIDAIVERINVAIENKELLILYGHAIPSKYKDNYGNSRVTEADLNNILKFIKEKVEDGKCHFLSCDEAIRQYYLKP